jgi:isopenicillin N synthase-like dioxygenase
MPTELATVGIIDLADPQPGALDRACRELGFFSVVNHGVSGELAQRLDRLSREFFALPESEKVAIAMTRNPVAWRGWFPLHGELTSGKPDRKEGLYFGTNDAEHLDRVMHGSNQYPSQPDGLAAAVDEWMAAMKTLADRLMALLASGLGLAPTWFADHLTATPTQLFRIFHYPAADPADPKEWGVGEHTDYGLLTILMQDDCGGLQVKSRGGWIEVPPIDGAFICNIGDMLDRLTAGRYRSTAHRVRNSSGRMRLSFPYFFDPSWDAELTPLPLTDELPPDDADSRWDRASVHAYSGTYGQYLTAKVRKVFPDLATA